MEGHRLRQACDHPLLAREWREARLLQGAAPLRTMAAADDEPLPASGLQLRTAAAALVAVPVLPPAVLKRLMDSLEDLEKECIICFDVAQDAVFTPCGHMFCRDCIITYHSARSTQQGETRVAPCPVCRHDFSEKTLVPASSVLPKEDDEEEEEEEKPISATDQARPAEPSVGERLKKLEDQMWQARDAFILSCPSSAKQRAVMDTIREVWSCAGFIVQEVARGGKNPT